MKTYHWGIVGLGEIAHQFAQTFNDSSSKLSAVASRTQEKAEEFASRYQIPKAYGDYTALLSDPEIDIIYIAVPNRQHIEYILPALKAGKHVLCEKAITMNQKELLQAVQLAEQKNLVLAEAMTIFNMPLYAQLRELADSGKLGKLKMIQAPFGSYKEPDPTNRFFNPDLAGGALLDIGTYAVSFARYFLNAQPTVIASNVLPFETGVDEQSVTILRNKKNEMAAVTLTFQAKMPKLGIVAFENGYITVPEYPRADKAEIIYNDGTKEFIESGDTQEAMNYEIQNMVAFIEGSKPNTSLLLTIDVIQLLDEMQQAWAKQ
ncbi:oxidoreductase NAD-binding Rossmann fold protein [Enterococcus phoeniculicola]|uniref:Oxidoreductase NAD-binding Rossmann fold protein n=1 Tax=Enterococcus phoeniculicola ATCC BAA-412 TaxID=1158610 RepID=R3WPZ3_9ENTE|nr:Gfo/Idh/MocA family oxidoreductase [Enterococcus phoeniculicola]EOL43900.1 oxidoreductase NAD-binding Rossmann fold protein [Enterococcus phoeniculicola ATCC BAA-412]EOT76736.1 oxidoreductase NAD-binding Rossmann fold protein [Enterococcus phoeniculicola ATCC BAA-412]OJG70546.1 oxidoreductase NAD-binding Rossmann fold protein [Enterococcus phoeniculicola]